MEDCTQVVKIPWRMQIRGAYKNSLLVLVCILLLIGFALPTAAGSDFFFSQKNIRWGNDVLGYSSRKVRQEGCALTCTAMVFKFYGMGVTPGTLNTHLKQSGTEKSANHGYEYVYDDKGVKHALIRWWIADDVTNGLVRYQDVERVDWPEKNGQKVAADLQVINRHLDSGHPLIVETRWNRSSMHFVVLTRRVDSTYYMYDPMDDRATSLTFNQRYGDPTRWIYGIRVFRGQSTITPIGGPSLRIDGSTSSQKQQLDTFHFTGSGFTPNSYVRQYFVLPGGDVRNPQRGGTIRVPPSGNISWTFTPQCTSPVGRYTIWVADLNNPEKDKSNYVYETITRNPSCSQTPIPSPQPSPLPTLPPTATVLVMDVSGSMGWRWKGGVKIESAKKAALEFIEQVTHEAQTRGGQHKIGVVAFSGGASVLLPLTSDYNRAKQVIISLSATNATNLGAGLVAGLGELNKTPSTTQRFIILLSDGETNTGLSRDQILNGPVVEARQKKICIHTVAFGDPGDIDANFLRKVGIGSGCGSYSHAETAFELFSTYLKLRHKSLGQVVGEYSSIGKRVTILPGVPISLGTVLIGSGKRELHYTLAWSEQGRLQIRLKDPSGMLISTSYPGAQIYTTDQFAHLTLLSPKSGAWTVEAAAGTSMPNGTEYYAVLSTRPGGIAIPLPLPIFTVGDRTFGLPSGLPTWLLVTISVALIALVLYKELSGH